MTTAVKPILLNDILDSVERKITPLVTARRHHYFSSIDENIRIKTDPQNLQLLLLSLLTNAINHTPSNSLIGLTIRNKRSERQLSICVADNGPLKLQRGEGPYFIPVTGLVQTGPLTDQPTYRQRELETVRKLAELQAGALSIDEIPEKGLRVTVELPL